MSKSAALLIGLLLITLFGVAAFVWPERMVILPPVLTAIVTLVSAFIGMQVANNGVKGRYWNQNMYDSENEVTTVEKKGEKQDGNK